MYTSNIFLGDLWFRFAFWGISNENVNVSKIITIEFIIYSYFNIFNCGKIYNIRIKPYLRLLATFYIFSNSLTYFIYHLCLRTLYVVLHLLICIFNVQKLSVFFKTEIVHDIWVNKKKSSLAFMVQSRSHILVC